MKLHSGLATLSLVSWVGLANLTGCALTHDMYTMPPAQLEQIRDELGAIGIVVSDDPGEQKIIVPAKGVVGGITRGTAAGAAFPIVLGFVSPVPGGTVIGVLLAPFSAVAGAVYGAAKALPAEEVAEAEAQIRLAVDELRAAGLSQLFMDEVVRLGAERAGLNFVPLPAVRHTAGDGPAQSAPPNFSGIGTLLKVRVEKTGLRGLYGIDPPIRLFIELDARLVRVDDSQVLLSERISCTSEEPKRYVEWAEKGGKRIVDEFTACVPALAEKVVDDFFLVYPAAVK